MARECYSAGPPLYHGVVAGSEAHERSPAELPALPDTAGAAPDVYHPAYQLHRGSRLPARRGLHVLCELGGGWGRRVVVVVCVGCGWGWGVGWVRLILCLVKTAGGGCRSYVDDE